MKSRKTKSWVWCLFLVLIFFEEMMKSHSTWPCRSARVLERATSSTPAASVNNQLQTIEPPSWFSLSKTGEQQARKSGQPKPNQTIKQSQTIEQSNNQTNKQRRHKLGSCGRGEKVTWNSSCTQVWGSLALPRLQFVPVSWIHWTRFLPSIRWTKTQTSGEV